MKLRSILSLVLYPFAANLASGALMFNIRPNDAGGTVWSLSQTSANPSLPTTFDFATFLRIDLPPAMFDPIIHHGGNPSQIFGSFTSIARFQDLGSGFFYDATGAFISPSSASFQFDRAFSQAPAQSAVQFDLVSVDPTNLESISPSALVKGTHSIASPLFGTVTVNVVPEPSMAWMIFLASTSLMLRRRRDFSDS
jgi:hypothetical protein